MKKFKKKYLILSLAVLTVFSSSTVFAFDDRFYDNRTIEYGKRVKPKQEKTEKGFAFSMKLKNSCPRNKSLANFVDIAVRHIKKIAKDELCVDEAYSEDYIDLLFKNYKIHKVTYDYLTVKFYVFPKERKFHSVKRFLRDKLLDKYYRDLFDKVKLQKEDYEKYKNSYILMLRKRLKLLFKKIAVKYKKNNFKELYSIFSDFLQNYASTTNILSTLAQDRKIKKKAEKIKQILEYMLKKNIKNKNKNDSLDYDEYDDYDDYDGYDDYDDYYSSDSRSLFKDYFDDEDVDYFEKKKHKNFGSLKKNLSEFFKLCIANTKSIKDLEFDKFKDSIDSFKFNYEIPLIKRMIKSYDQYVETIVENN